MYLTVLEMARRVRFRSWKDVLVFVLMIPIYILLTWGVKKLFPNLPEKAANVIIFIIMVILTVVLLFAVGA